MNTEQALRDVDRRLRSLEQGTSQARHGKVTATSPLTVDVASSGVGIASIQTTVKASSLSVGDDVLVNKQGRQAIVTGKVGGVDSVVGGSDSISISSASTASKSVTHGLGTTPSAVVATTGDSTFVLAVSGINSTSFTITIRYYIVGTATATISFQWMAVA